MLFQFNCMQKNSSDSGRVCEGKKCEGKKFEVWGEERERLTHDHQGLTDPIGFRLSDGQEAVSLTVALLKHGS